MYHRPAGNTILGAIVVLAACTQQAGDEDPVPAADVGAASPAVGYDIHVTAPHVVNGAVMGPFHHYCRVHRGEVDHPRANRSGAVEPGLA
jgi:hypothetical protein